jgi:very-short-patch-repair endonuclease
MDTPRQTIRRAKELRGTMSPPEVRLWQVLRRAQLKGLRFRRQHPIGPYILDFYCDALRMCIEIDGNVHEHRFRHDQRRDAWLKRQGITVVRIPAEMVFRELDRVAEVIAGMASEMVPVRPLRRAARDTSPKGGG